MTSNNGIKIEIVKRNATPLSRHTEVAEVIRQLDYLSDDKVIKIGFGNDYNRMLVAYSTLKGTKLNLELSTHSTGNKEDCYLFIGKKEGNIVSPEKRIPQSKPKPIIDREKVNEYKGRMLADLAEAGIGDTLEYEFDSEAIAERVRKNVYMHKWSHKTNIELNKHKNKLYITKRALEYADIKKNIFPFNPSKIGTTK